MGQRVYICDDEEGMLRYLAKTLAELGYEVRTFSAASALFRELTEA